MRSRSVWLIPATLLAGLPLIIPLTTAQATASPRPAMSTRAVASPPAIKAAAQRAVTVTLPTGERVRLSGESRKPQVLVEPVAKSGPGRVIVSRRLGERTYVMPAAAQAYLGRFLDKSLFDITSLAAAREKRGRMPVRISYRGAAPEVPGVTFTTKRNGVAHGYLTPESAPAFGRALTARWMADAKAGFPKRDALFTGVTKIRADIPRTRTGTATPKDPMHTLTIKTIGADGKPQPAGVISLLNVDDGRKYWSTIDVENGGARVSVPEGTYSVAGDDLTSNPDQSSVLRIVTINEYEVKGAGQTLTLDYRTATAEPSVVVPKPANVGSWSLQWYRTDVQQNLTTQNAYFLDHTIRVLLAPAGPTKIGHVSTSYTWSLTEPLAAPTYAYSVTARDHQIPEKPQYTFTDAQLATVDSAYYGDGTSRTAGFFRYPAYDDTGAVGTFGPVRYGTRRTEFVGANVKNLLWGDDLLMIYDGAEDQGYVRAPRRSLPPGSKTAVDWMKGPLAPAIPNQSANPYCYACRYGDTMTVGLASFTDSDLTHAGGFQAAEDGLPVARFRIYRNGKLLSDLDDFTGGQFAVPPEKGAYKAILDVDRRLMNPTQSTRTRTELTFGSAKGAGKKLPASWECDGQNCRVLPIVQARLSLPLSLNGTLPAGKSTITLAVDQIQPAAASAITQASLEIRDPDPKRGWVPVKLTSIGAGKYQGVIDNTRLAGSQIDVRYGGADRAGSTFRQTVLDAYTVAGS